MAAFDDAADVIFTDDNLSRDALYRAGGVGAGTSARIVFAKPVRDMPFGETGKMQRDIVAHARLSEIAAAKPGDTLEIASVLYRVETAAPDGRDITVRLGLSVKV